MSGRILCGLVLVGIALGVTIGCAGPTSDRPATYPVTGIVTLDGSPVAGAAVTFVPSVGGKSAAGVTDASGKYALTTFEGGDGAVPGDYSVKIVKYEGGEVGGEETGEGDAGMMSADYEAGVESGEDEAAKNLLPEKYSDAKTSGLKATVTEGENSFDFPLES